MIYTLNGCTVYYGGREEIINLICSSNEESVYGWTFETEEKMLLQLEYYRSVKDNAKFVNMEKTA